MVPYSSALHTELSRTLLTLLSGCVHPSSAILISQFPTPLRHKFLPRCTHSLTRYEWFPAEPHYFKISRRQWIRGSMTAWPQWSPFSPFLPICLPRGCLWAISLFRCIVYLSKWSELSPSIRWTATRKQTNPNPLMAAALYIYLAHSRQIPTAYKFCGHFWRCLLIWHQNCTESAVLSGF